MNVSKRELSQSPLFDFFERQDFEYYFSRMRLRKVKPGEIIFNKTGEDEHFYIIASGQVEVVLAAGLAEERLVGLWGEGELISEILFMNLKEHMNTRARAITRVQLFEMTRADFDQLMIQQPGLAYEIVKGLSKRVNTSQDKVIHDLKEKNVQLEQAYDALKTAQNQIIEKEKMESELQVAHNIQMSILPHKLPRLEEFDFGALVVPMRAIGGDFYDFIPLGENKLGIAIGDVSGHGVPAAIYMALTVTLLRAEACRACSAEEVLLNVNRQLIRLNDESMFVTILYGVLDIKTGEFNFVRAGHEMPILYSNKGRLVVAPFEPGQPLGLFATPTLSAQVIQLKKGGTMLLYTDGATEAINNENEMFGQKRLKNGVRKYNQRTAQEICDCIFEMVTTYRGEAPQSDDITLLCIQAQ